MCPRLNAGLTSTGRGNPGKPLDFFVTLGIPGNPWVSLENPGYPWETLDIPGYLWKTPEMYHLSPGKSHKIFHVVIYFLWLTIKIGHTLDLNLNLVVKVNRLSEYKKRSKSLGENAG